MIIHGRKQISEIVYARNASDGGGAIRLSNIIRGPQVVFGGLKPTIDWLKAATKQAILGAFGVSDGKAVIKATNAYLNQLAATDPTKATALARFINAYAVEDAHIVYSLVPTLGVRRWLGTNDGAHIDTGFKATDYAHSYLYEVIWKTAQSSGGSIIGTIANNAGFGQIYVNGSISQLWGGVGNTNTNLNASLALDTEYTDSVKFDFDAGKVTRITDGVSQTNTHNISTRPSTSAFLYAYNNGGSPAQKTKCSFADVKLYGDDVLVKWFVPFIRNNVNGMLDLIGGTFYANAGSGSFTISETPATP